MSLPLKPGRTFIIAEAGTNHADLDTKARFRKAMEYVEAAWLCGADAVKFQWFAHERTIWLEADMFCWIDGDKAREPRWRQSVMELDEWRQVKEYAEACGLTFLASAFQARTVQWLIELKLAATKVASRAAKNFPYDKEGLPRPFLVSLGMAMSPSGIEIVPLQCEARYPSTEAWGGLFGGFSDHSGKPFLGIDAISRGCEILEVHYMIDRLDAGPDLPACLSIDELKLLCKARDYYANRAA